MSDTASSTKHKAGLFDIRIIIGTLLAIYGVIVLLTGLFATDSRVQDSKSINIWVGVGLLASAAVFVVWTMTRPIVVPDEPASDGGPPPGH